jgi:hypothetical protein
MGEPNELAALEDDVIDLLARAKGVSPLDTALKASLLASVEARLHLPQAGGDGGGDGSIGGHGPEGATGAGAMTSLSSNAGAIASAGTHAAIGIALAVGIVAGVAIDRTILAPSPARPAVTTATVAPPPALAVAPAESGGMPVSSLPPAPPPLPSPAAAPRRPAEPVPAVSARGLGAERALLDVARGALARGEAREALVAADRHEKEYPAGALVEEREAIAIRALVAVGRRDEARQRAFAFERRFPNGLMLRAVKSAVGEEP